MNKFNYIALGNSGDVLIYVPKKDSLYKAYKKIPIYEPDPFNRTDMKAYATYQGYHLIGGLSLLVILPLFMYTKIFAFINDFSVFICLLLSFAISVIYQHTILQKEAYTLLKGKYEKIDIKYDVALWNRLYITTKDGVKGLIIIIVIATVVWIVLEDVSIQAGDFDSICKLIAFMFFVLAGIIMGSADLPGRIKLLYRLHKEKQ